MTPEQWVAWHTRWLQKRFEKPITVRAGEVLVYEIQLGDVVEGCRTRFPVETTAREIKSLPESTQ